MVKDEDEETMVVQEKWYQQQSKLSIEKPDKVIIK